MRQIDENQVDKREIMKIYASHQLTKKLWPEHFKVKLYFYVGALESKNVKKQSSNIKVIHNNKTI